MHVLQLEIPETFTTTTQVPNVAAAQEFSGSGRRYTSLDLNQLFWHWLLTKHAGINLKDALDLSGQTCRNIEIAVTAASARFDIPITEDGLQLPDEILMHSNYLVMLSEHEAFLDYCNAFFVEVLSPLIEELSPQIISWGVAGTNPLAFAIGLTTILRNAHGNTLKIGIGRHTTENFSLRLRKDALESSGHLAQFFDFLIYEEENYVAELLKFGGDQRPGVPEEPISGTGWIRSTDPAGPEMTVCRMPLSRNRCYWDRCTFCVQVKTQSPDFKFHDRDEYQRSLETLASLHHHGYRYFLFEDQAVSPRNIKRLCQFLEDKRIDIQWTIRTIADADFDETLIQRMAANGCTEVLFGLETVSKETATLMGKISRDNSVSEIGELLDRFTRNHISVFLNVIYGFPTESNEAFNETLTAVRRFREVSQDLFVQFNRFTLYVNTDIYNDPSSFGLTLAEDSDADLSISIDYEDQFGRNAATDLSDLVPDDTVIESHADLIEIKLRSGSIGFIELCKGRAQ